MNPEYYKVQFLAEMAPDQLPDKFFIITACNPMDQKLPLAENQQRNHALEKRILQAGHLCLPIVGASPDFTHQEASWITNGPKECILSWAQEYNQRAIFRIQKDELSILPCDYKEEPIALGSFRARLNPNPLFTTNLRSKRSE